MISFPDSQVIEQQLVRQLTDFSRQKILELGVGDGRTLLYYPEDLQGLIGLDLAWTELALARKQNSTLPLIHGDAVTLPLAANAVDTVVWSWAL